MSAKQHCVKKYVKVSHLPKISTMFKEYSAEYN